MNRLLLLLIFPMLASAANYNAATCGQTDVGNAIALEQATPVDGDTITIPAGNCSWVGPNSLIPATFTVNVTIQGGGAVSATQGGSSTTGSDVTTFTDNFPNSGRVMLELGIVAGKTLRITGIYFKTGSALSSDLLFLGGAWTSQVRVDHCHFYVNNVGVQYGGALIGVIDHNFFDTGTNGSPGSNAVTNDTAFHNGDGWNGVANDANADGSWADGSNFGTNKFVYVEDNFFNNGDIGDAHDGGRYVLRFNTITNNADVNHNCGLGTFGNSQMFNHGTTNANGSATRAAEVYWNVFTQPLAACGAGGANTAYSLNSGTLLIWQNTVTNYRSVVAIGQTRFDGGTYGQQVPPYGWGYCGNTNGPSAWDGNTNSGGYPCIYGPGRGQGDLLAGSFWGVWQANHGYTGQDQLTDAANHDQLTNSNCTSGATIPTFNNSGGTTADGTCTWHDQGLGKHNTALSNTVAYPRQALDPVYAWNNTFTTSPGFPVGSVVANGASPSVTQDQDYYSQFGNSSPWAGFTGATGVGQGVIASRPATCTTGVAYWATDQGTWNNFDPTKEGVLYICTATNTWTLSYTPFTYPYPFAGGGAPVVTYTPSSVSFSPTLVNQSSAATNVTLQNTGSATLNVSSFTLTNNKFYVINNTCGTPATLVFGGAVASFSLAAARLCTFSVVYLPQSVNNADAGGVIAIDDTAGGSDTLTLSGTGLTAPVATPQFQ